MTKTIIKLAPYLLRFSLAFIFLWAAFDKTFGLGFSTPSGKAWIDGISPTTGFLQNATTGVLGHYFKLLAHNVLVDILFMTGLYGIGFSLLTGIGVKLMRITGPLLMLLMWAALVPTKTNPLIDEHIIYALVLLLLPKLGAFRSSK